MGFSAYRERLAKKVDVFIATEKLWIAQDGSRLVPDGHPSARSLFCVKGREIPLAEARRWGLVQTELAPAVKQRLPQETKESRPQVTKQNKTKSVRVAKENKPAPTPKPKKPPAKVRKEAIPSGRGTCPYCKRVFLRVKKHAQRMHGA